MWVHMAFSPRCDHLSAVMAFGSMLLMNCRCFQVGVLPTSLCHVKSVWCSMLDSMSRSVLQCPHWSCVRCLVLWHSMSKSVLSYQIGGVFHVRFDVTVFNFKVRVVAFSSRQCLHLTNCLCRIPCFNSVSSLWVDNCVVWTLCGGVIVASCYDKLGVSTVYELQCSRLVCFMFIQRLATLSKVRWCWSYSRKDDVL